ncbi:MAG TPA: ABC transporter substrate-binding protein [Stellaceae bacterium]|nr:ABC transporter substrate-binding protein [Stellaceae bacterium]
MLRGSKSDGATVKRYTRYRNDGRIVMMRLGWARLAAAALMILPMANAARAEDYAINAILSLTGNGAFLAGGQKKVLELEAEIANAQGGIGGRNVRFVFHDDQSSPQVAVQLLNEIMATHPPVIVGSSLVAMCSAMVPLLAQGPVLYCLSPGYHPPAGSYAFSANTSTWDSQVSMVRYFREKGLTKIATITSSDATGQDADRGIDAAVAMPENAGVQIVDREHFNLSDVSVAAQLERVRAAHPQLVLAWATGSPSATIFKGLLQAGIELPVATTGGNQLVAQMRQFKAFLPKELYAGGGDYPPHAGLYKLDPRVEAAQQTMYAALKKTDLSPDVVIGTSWDAGLIVIATLRALGPDATAEQVRAHIAHLTDFPGVSGVYNFVASPERGLGVQDTIVLRWDAAHDRFIWVSKPGGDPL